jgi:hypothetical protein
MAAFVDVKSVVCISVPSLRAVKPCGRPAFDHALGVLKLLGVLRRGANVLFAAFATAAIRDAAHIAVRDELGGVPTLQNDVCSIGANVTGHNSTPLFVLAREEAKTRGVHLSIPSKSSRRGAGLSVRCRSHFPRAEIAAKASNASGRNSRHP